MTEAIAFNMEINVTELRKLVYSDEFAQFLLSHTSDFGIAAYVLQTCFEAVDKIESISDQIADNVDNDE